jgi:hypothetical protein
MTTQQSEKDLFLEISVYLTGFDEAELQGTGMVETYYQAVLSNNTQPDVSYFFEMVAAILKENESNEDALNKAISSHLMPASAYSGMAMNIINMWYTGNWGQNVVSGQAYIQGLVWDAAEAHPPGAKQPGYGSWAIPPL